MCPGRTGLEWRAQADDFGTFLGEFVSTWPQAEFPFRL